MRVYVVTRINIDTGYPCLIGVAKTEELARRLISSDLDNLNHMYDNAMGYGEVDYEVEQTDFVSE